MALVGVEAGGRSDRPGDHAATLCFGRPGVLHGSFSYVLQDDDGQTAAVHSISAGLDYPGIGPEHSYWKETRPGDATAPRMRRPWLPSTRWRATKASCPPWKVRHAVAKAMELAAARRPEEAIVVCLSGRGDKDAHEIARLRGEEERV